MSLFLLFDTAADIGADDEDFAGIGSRVVVSDLTGDLQLIGANIDGMVGLEEEDEEKDPPVETGFNDEK